MSDILSSLTLASRALEAQHRGLNATGQNIANVNTPGYTRRVVDFASVPPPDANGAGRGVEATGIRAMRDRLLERRLEREVPAERREAAVAESLAVVEAALGQPGQAIDGRLTALFDAFASLAEDPQSPNARYEVKLQGQALATAFQDISSRLTSSADNANRQIRVAVEEVNDLAEQIAGINRTLVSSGQGTFLDLQDKQTQLVRELAGLMDVSVLERPEGGLDISFGNGRPLVIGVTTYGLSAVPAAPSGYVAVTAGDANVGGEITAGRLGGLLQTRDVTLPYYQEQLDTLAFETVAQVNTLHAAGFDQGGAAAGDFFSFSAAPSGVAGAAAAVQVDAAIAADVRLIAAGGTTAAGDNTTARALAALRDARVLESGTATLNDAWSQLVFRVGRDSQAAQQEQQTRAEIVAQVDDLRDQVSGISLDEEAMQMLKYQRAYEASARFFNVVSGTLDTLLAALGR